MNSYLIFKTIVFFSKYYIYVPVIWYIPRFIHYLVNVKSGDDRLIILEKQDIGELENDTEWQILD
jgi:hypothetical protein